jgi:hypothetical protein
MAFPSIWIGESDPDLNGHWVQDIEASAPPILGSGLLNGLACAPRYMRKKLRGLLAKSYTAASPVSRLCGYQVLGSRYPGELPDAIEETNSSETKLCRISAALRRASNSNSDFVGVLVIRNEHHGRDASLYSIEVQFPKLDVAGSIPASRSWNQELSAAVSFVSVHFHWPSCLPHPYIYMR